MARLGRGQPFKVRYVQVQSLGTVISVSSISCTATVRSTNISASVNKAVSTIARTVTVYAPAVTSGAVAQPSCKSVTTTRYAVTVSTGSKVLPSTRSCTTTSYSISFSVTLSPSTISARVIGTYGNYQNGYTGAWGATISAGSTTSPSVRSCTATVPAVIVTANSTVSASLISVATSVKTVTIHASSSTSVSTIAVNVTSNSPTAHGSALVLATTISDTATVRAVAITVFATASPSVQARSASFGAPAIFHIALATVQSHATNFFVPAINSGSVTVTPNAISCSGTVYRPSSDASAPASVIAVIVTRYGTSIVSSAQALPSRIACQTVRYSSSIRSSSTISTITKNAAVTIHGGSVITGLQQVLKPPLKASLITNSNNSVEVLDPHTSIQFVGDYLSLLIV